MYDQSQRCCYILTTTQKLWIVIQLGITGWQEQSMRSLDEWYIAKTWKLWHVKPSIGSRILLDCVSARQNNRMEGWSQGVLLSNWSEWTGLNDNKLFSNMIGSADERHFTVFDRLMLPVSAARSQYLPQWKDHDTLREGELWSLKTNAQSTYKILFQKLSRCGLDFSMCCYL